LFKLVKIWQLQIPKSYKVYMEPSYHIVTPYVSRPLSKKFSFHTTIIHVTQIHEINIKYTKQKNEFIT